MKYDYLFFINSIMLGVGLAMDAFSVSSANGLKENNMKKSRMSFIRDSKASLAAEEFCA